MATGGSMESISIAGREFAVAGDADTQRKLGGFENTLESNGNGTVRLIKTRVPWLLSGINIEIDDDAGDQEFLQDLADRKTFEAISFTYASGVTYQGTGQVLDELNFGNQATTSSLSLGGPGKATKQ